MGPVQFPLLMTLLVFVVVLVGGAVVGLRLVSKRAGGVHVSAGVPAMQSTAVAPPPPPPIQPDYPVSNPVTSPVGTPGGSLHCPNCGAGSSSDYCAACGFDIRTLAALPYDPRTFNPHQPVPATPPAKKRRQNAVWPYIIDAASARFAARLAMFACFFCAGSTLLFIFLARQGMSMVDGIDEKALIDVAVFIGLGIAIFRMLRIAAVAALALYVVERIYMWAQVTAPGGPSLPMMILLLLCFISGVRGTFAYRNYLDTSLDV